MRHRIQHVVVSALVLGMVTALAPNLSTARSSLPTTERAESLMNSARHRVTAALKAKGFKLGQPIFLRIFKMPGELEVWVKKGSRYELFKTYEICSYSGYPGPKLFEGDWQSPEGFYSISPRQMNPNSRYHLSFNIGFPNAFDRERNRTGSAIMVHGGCSSRGCFAMGDKKMEEIYLLAHSALARGQENFSLHIFPFRMTSHNMAKFKSSPWFGFWKNLEQGYKAFEMSHQVPMITAVGGKYVVNDRFKLAMNDKTGKTNAVQ
jgi:murein L,D-transpeptidase YafK